MRGLLAGLLAAVACGQTGDDAGRDALSPPAAREGAREVLAETDPFERSARLGALLERARPDSLPDLRAELDAAPLVRGDPELVSFGMWWARFDPEAAFDWVEREWEPASWPLLRAVFRTWAHSAPEAAFAKLAEVPSPRREVAIDGLIAGWSESGRPGLVEQVQAIPDLVSRQKTAEVLAARAVVDRGAEGALRWLEEIGDPAFRRMVGRRLASAAAERGEAGAVAEWARAQVTAGDAHPSGLPRRIATRWVLRDPEAAWAWLESLPAGKDRDDGVMEAFRDWLRQKPGPAMLWIRDAELEPWLEPAFSIYARRLAARSPEEALVIVSRFTNEAERERFTIQILRGWAARDAEAAAAWVERAELGEALQSRARDLVARAKEAAPRPGAQAGQGEGD